jgi:hypothetical protein
MTLIRFAIVVRLADKNIHILYTRGVYVNHINDLENIVRPLSSAPPSAVHTLRCAQPAKGRALRFRPTKGFPCECANLMAPVPESHFRRRSALSKANASRVC